MWRHSVWCVMAAMTKHNRGDRASVRSGMEFELEWRCGLWSEGDFFGGGVF